MSGRLRHRPISYMYCNLLHSISKHIMSILVSVKTSLIFFFCIFRTLPALNFAVLENYTLTGCTGISEGTIFKLSTLSFASFPILSLFDFIYKRTQKNHPGLYGVVGPENRPFHRGKILCSKGAFQLHYTSLLNAL
jgi:hypothetical protein